MISTAFLMDKMGNDTEGIVVLIFGLSALLVLVWLGGLLVRFLREKMHQSE